MLALRVCAFALLVDLCFSEDPPLVTTTLGKIRGHYLFTAANLRYEAYEGVPFAEPPTGPKRFEPPTPVKPWKDVVAADEKRQSCWVHDYHIKGQPAENKGSEDCLYLNVYVPEKRSTKTKLPVLIYIHGGGFQFSTLKAGEQNNFMDKNVIFVSITYRLGALGFLSTEDEVVSGNMGLKDQAMALKWVKEHIESFGGDSSRITLVGESAGGASIHYHYLSPMSAGLFSAGISISGTALMPWTQAKNSREKAFKLAELVNCNKSDVRKMVECLRYKPAKDLAEAQSSFMGWQETDFSPFGPVVERNVKDAFIDRPPIDIINSGEAQNVPWITSMTSEEGLFPVIEFGLNQTAMNELDQNWETVAPHLLQYYYSAPKSEHSKIARRARQYYLGDRPIGRQSLLALTHLVGDRIFGTDSVKAAKLQARASNSPVYYYYFTYRPALSLTHILTSSKKNYGASHADDILLVFRELADSKEERRDSIMQKRLIDLWLSVAQTGQPAADLNWKRLDPKGADFNYLRIDKPGKFKMDSDDRLASNQFWDSIDFKENIPNYRV